MIRQHPEHDFWVNDLNNKKDMTYEKVLAILKSQEGKEGDVNFLNIIIRNGGFIDYINKLEKI